MYTSCIRFGGLLLAVMMGATAVQAQEFNTGTSIREQLKNNSVPGLRYGPATQPKPQTRKTVDITAGKESSGRQLRNGTLPGLPAAKGTGAAKSALRSKVPAGTGTAAKKGSLPSDGPVTERKLQPVTGLQQPTQGNGDDKTPKATPAKQMKLPELPMQSETPLPRRNSADKPKG